MKISVELEPPKGGYGFKQERISSVEDEIKEYTNFVDLISITNRPVFGLSTITMGKRVSRILNKLKQQDINVAVHLTTRLSLHDTFRAVLDAHRIGLTDIMPILGQPRGPIDSNYFTNGFEIIGFIAYLKSGKTEFLSDRLQSMLDKGQLVQSLDDVHYHVGSVIDLNPEFITKERKSVNIREKQLNFALRKKRYGAEYLISQGIFDAQYYFDFIDNLNEKVPIIPGILPARLGMIERFGLPISSLDKQRLRAQLTTTDERIAGNQIANKVFRELEEGGCKQIHVYSLGNANNFLEITGLIDRTIETKIQSQNVVVTTSKNIMSRKNDKVE